MMYRFYLDLQVNLYLHNNNENFPALSLFCIRKRSSETIDVNNRHHLLLRSMSETASETETETETFHLKHISYFFHHSWATSKDETETETVFLGHK